MNIRKGTMYVITNTSSVERTPILDTSIQSCQYQVAVNITV
jgi:hypothetical protein